MARKLRGQIINGEFEKDFDIEELSTIVTSILGLDGKEYPNPQSMFVDDAMGRPSSIEEQVARVLIKKEAIARMNGFDTLEEADDLTDTDEFASGMFASGYEVEENILPEEQPVVNNSTNDLNPEGESVIDQNGENADTVK